MRIATYNVWNSEKGMPQREQYLIDEIKKTVADVVCLQEVRDRTQAELIAWHAGYPYWFFDSYLHEDEGLCVLSKRPFAKIVSWIESDVRVDRILLRNTYPVQFPQLNQCSVFGKKVYEDIGLCASDHYGVMVELE